VLFDLDGTLLDTAPDFAAVINRMLAETGREALPYDRIRGAVSNGSRALVELAFALSEGEPGFAALRERLLALYEADLAVATQPFPGMDALIATLAARGLSWGVVTNKPAWLAEPLLARMPLTPGPGVLICPEHVRRTKPDPEPLLLACDRIGCSPAATVYVGDHLRDIEAGRAAGMRTIAAAYGYLGPGESAGDWGADHVVDSVEALAELLLGEIAGARIA
jgi:phosphoglycolate phosphatase